MATIAGSMPPEAAGRSQGRHALVAAYLGWTLDAFDFCIMAFVLDDIAKAFAVPLGSAAFAITLTLMFRTLGALIFGLLAERFGRRLVLMINVLCFSVLEFASGLAPTFWALLALRALFGIAMGGEWGIGGALVMESVSKGRRGLASGLLQCGYPSGYLLASLLFLAMPLLGWRGMFMVGALPALLVLYVRRNVAESPVWRATSADARKASFIRQLRGNLGIGLFAVVNMAAFNFLAHGAEDIYPSALLRDQRGLSTDAISMVMIVANIGAMLGAIFFGQLSEYIGRKWAMVLAVLLSLPVLPFWAAAATPLALAVTDFAMMVCVQGAWGVVPVYLAELSPSSIRGTFPGFAIQVGNFIAAATANMQIWLANRMGGDFGLAMAVTVAVTAVATGVLTAAGPESRRDAFDPPS